jgi:peptidoglycan/LPS O-acetylase OafA/YrhL
VNRAVVERPRPSPAVIAWRAPEVRSSEDGRPSRLIADQPALDGLRGVAVAGVLLFHAGFSWAVGGFLGVSTFFTLSGFLITSLLICERRATGRIRLRAFWARRFRRLMPAALLTLGLIVLYGAFLATPAQVQALRGDVLAALGYVANWHFLFSGQSYGQLFSSPSPVEHFWSLAIEEQFYFVFPLLAVGVLAVARGSRRALGVTLGVLAIGSVLLTTLLYHPGGDTSRVYYGTDTRAAELLVGALLAVLLSRRFVLRKFIPRLIVLSVGTAALIATIAVWVTTDQYSSWLYQGGLGLYALGSAAIIAAALQPGLVRNALSIPPLRWLGRISYGVYLIHWPVYLWLSPGRTGLDPWPLFVIRMAVTLALAAASYHLVERRIRTRRLLTGWRPLAVAPAVVLVVIVALVLVTTDPPKPAITFAAPRAPRAPARELLPPLATTPSQTGAALIGAPPPRPAPPPLTPGQRPRVLIAGDSSAFELGVGLARWGDDSGTLKVWDSGKFGCGVLQGGLIRFTYEVLPTTECKSWPDFWGADLVNIRPHIVLVMVNVWDVADRLLPGDSKWRHPGDPKYDELLRQGIAADIDLLSSQGATVAWVLSPYIQPGLDRPGGPWPEGSHKRMDRLNTIIREVVSTRWDRSVVVDMQGHMRARPQGELDWSERPDGNHFSDDASYAMAQSWLGQTVTALAPR